MTNGDKIRQMLRDEAIAAYMSINNRCPPLEIEERKCLKIESCYECRLEWLEQEVEV